MNGLFSMFLGTPPGEKKKNERPKVSDEDNDNAPTAAGNDKADETQKKKPPMPHRASIVRGGASLGRARSLSRVYNQVPRDRPAFRQAQQDVIEYYAHLALMETDPERVKEENEHLEQAAEGCTFRPYGRVYSRMQIACVCVDIGMLRTDDNLRDDDDDEDEPGFSASQWKRLREQFIVVKGFLLRKDANAAVPIKRRDDDNDDDVPAENDDLDASLEKHEMFQDSYNEVLFLLEIQETLASFYEQLKAVDTESPELIKQVESAVDTYRSALQNHFDSANRGNQDGQDKPHVPEVLQSFVLRDIQSAPKEALEKLLHHVLKVLRTQNCVYSHAQVKLKMKAVLTKWSESILEIPQLVQLGYGGVMAPIPINAGDEDDDVSSYGVAEDTLLTQKEAEENDTEPLPFRNHSNKHRGRRTSFADEARAAQAAGRMPSKSPRKQGQRKSPPRVQQRAVFQKHDDDSDESFTQDPAGSDLEYGGALDSRRAGGKRHDGRAAAASAVDSDVDSPRRSRARSPPNKNRNKRRRTVPVKPDPDDLWDDREETPVAKRRTFNDWTRDETEAVREGYAMFGTKWQMIKHNSDGRLSRRTIGHIHDKWKTMVRAGEIAERSALPR